MNINEIDILLSIESYQYTKAKKSLLYFLKTIIQTLQSQHNEDILTLSNNNCISSVIFSILSKTSKNIHSNQDNYKEHYKDILRFLSANIFKPLNCNELIFKDSIELDEFLIKDVDVVDLLLKCNIDKKITLLQTLYFQLNNIGKRDNISPTDVLNILEGILLKTNLFSMLKL